jgi:hypothetical protein
MPQDMNDKYDRWWATDEPPSPWSLALLCLIGLAGLFSIVAALLS